MNTTESGIQSFDQQIRNDLLRFFLFTYAVSWILWLAAVAILRGIPSNHQEIGVFREMLFLPGTFAPALVALTLTSRASGNQGVKTLLNRIFEWRVGTRWYLFAIGYLAAIKLIVALVYRVITGTWPRFGQESWYIIVIATFISMWVQAGEEIGWRGYSLPRLTEKFGLARSGILLGIIWACWHLPFFFISGIETSGQSFPVYLLQVTAISVAMTWLYWRTKGSLLPVMLMHAAVNNTKDIVPSAVQNTTKVFTLNSSLVGWLTVALLWIAAVYFLLNMRNAKLRNQ